MDSDFSFQKSKCHAISIKMATGYIRKDNEFMDGVIIIKECTVMSTMGYIMMIVAYIVTMTLSVGAYKVGDVLEYKTDDDIYKRVGVTFSLIFLFVGTFIALRIVPYLEECQKPSGEYKVTVSSNVDMNEFQKRYDIIDYNNGVYIVKPKLPKKQKSTEQIHHIKNPWKNVPSSSMVRSIE